MRRTLGNSSAFAIGAAFRQASRGLVHRVKPAGTVSLIFAAAALCAPPQQQAQAATVIVTITGTVSSGTVSSGSTANVFGFPPGTDLTGQSFTLVYTIDDTQGCEFFAPTGGGPYSFIEFSTTPCVAPKTGTPGNPVTSAVLTIGGSVSYGNQPYSVINGSEAYQVANYAAQYSLGENYYVGNYSGGGDVYANIYFINPPYAASYNWESPFTYTPGPPPTDGATGGSFSYSLVLFDPTTSTTVSSQSAAGTLAISSLTVSGPGCPSAAASTAAGANTAAQAICPPQPPHIYFWDASAGKFIDATANPQSVVIGQQIRLIAMPTATPVQPQPWSATGATVGGFDHPSTCPSTLSTRCGGPIDPDFTQPMPLFYWFVPDTDVVTYSYTNQDGTSGQATAIFYVKGPTNANVAAARGTVQVIPPSKFPDYNLGYYLACGNIDLRPCLTLEAIADLTTIPTSLKGNFRWAQLIYDDTLNITNSKGSKTCPAGNGLDITHPGLDTGYPYAQHDSLFTSDSPSVLLHHNDDTATRSFYARMYLLWTWTNLPNAIDVPLGYVVWGWDGTAIRNGSQWELSTPQFQPNLSLFIRSVADYFSAYPSWYSVTSTKDRLC